MLLILSGLQMMDAKSSNYIKLIKSSINECVYTFVLNNATKWYKYFNLFTFFRQWLGMFRFWYALELDYIFDRRDGSWIFAFTSPNVHIYEG